MISEDNSSDKISFQMCESIDSLQIKRIMKCSFYIMFTIFMGTLATQQKILFYSAGKDMEFTLLIGEIESEYPASLKRLPLEKLSYSNMMNTYRFFLHPLYIIIFKAAMKKVNKQCL